MGGTVEHLTGQHQASPAVVQGLGEGAAGQAQRGGRQHDVAERLTGAQAHGVVVLAGAERQQHRIVGRLPHSLGEAKRDAAVIASHPTGSGNDGQLHPHPRGADVQQLQRGGRDGACRVTPTVGPAPGDGGGQFGMRGPGRLLDDLEDRQVVVVRGVGEPPDARVPARCTERHGAVVQHSSATEQHVTPVRRRLSDLTMPIGVEVHRGTVDPPAPRLQVSRRRCAGGDIERTLQRRPIGKCGHQPSHLPFFVRSDFRLCKGQTKRPAARARDFPAGARRRKTPSYRRAPTTATVLTCGFDLPEESLDESSVY